MGQDSCSLYFGGCEVRQWARLTQEAGVHHVAINYRYLRERCKPERFSVEKHFPPDQEVWLDAGAFGINEEKWDQAALEDYLLEYLAFAEANLGALIYVTELDATALGWDWIVARRNDSYTTIPEEKLVYVWHPEWGIPVLRAMVNGFPNIAVPSMDKGVAANAHGIARSTGKSLMGLRMAHPFELPGGIYKAILSGSWISPTKYGETHVWDHNRMRRYSPKQKDMARKRHANDFRLAGFDPEKIAADDNDEINRYTIWAWRQLEASLAKARFGRRPAENGKGVTPTVRRVSDENADVDMTRVETLLTEGARILSSRGIDVEAVEAPHLPALAEPQIIPGFALRPVEVEVPNPDKEGEMMKVTQQVVTLSGASVRQCDSCLTPDTPVLTSSFLWKPIGEVGTLTDLAGFDEEPWMGRSRKWAPSRVEAVKWRSEEAYRVITDRGEVVATSVHPWLVHGQSWIPTGKLSVGQSLRWTEPHASQSENDPFRRGYIAGITQGDGTHRFNPKLPRSEQPSPYWRVALSDHAPLVRLQRYLKGFGVDLTIKAFNPGEPREGGLVARPVNGFKPMEKLETKKYTDLMRLHYLTEVISKRSGFYEGYLSGMFDAEGSFDGHSIRITSNDLGELEKCRMYGERIGLHFVVEKYANRACSSIRLVGGGPAILKFFALCRPALKRKSDKWWGRSLLLAPARIEAVESVGVRDVVDIQTSTATFMAGGFATHNCSLSGICPASQPGAACSLHMPVQIRSTDQLLGVLTTAIELQWQRVAFGKFAEDMEGGYPNQNLSGELDRLFKLISAFKDITDNRDTLSLTVKARDLSGGQGLLKKIFGAQATEPLRAVDADAAEEYVKKAMA